MTNFLSIGIALLFIGALLIFFSMFSPSVGKQQPSKTTIKAAGGIFIGPFPIFGFASDKKMLYLLMAAAFALIIISFIFLKLK